MILHVFSFYDSKAGYFSTPFFFPHPGQAIRTAIDLGSDTSTGPGRYPEDFTLYRIGSFNDQTAIFESEPPVSLGSVSSLMPRGEPSQPRRET